MSCEDQIDATDLENAKDDVTTIAEVATSRAGGDSGGALIDSATTRHGDSVSTLRGQLSKLGYEPPIAHVSGISFTVDDGAKTIEEGGLIYAPLISALPFTTTSDFSADKSNFRIAAIQRLDGEIRVGDGSATPQPNAAFQSVRDHTVLNGFSIHGFIVSDYFAIDTNAMNSFGSDVLVGDGTQGSGFLLNHLHDFQSRDIIDLGDGGMQQHATVITFDELRSGTVQSKYGALFVDLLGQFDTPGLNIPNFEVNGAATVNNQTGIRTVIKHGNNPRSAHFSAGVNDSGATISSGGAPVDIECPTVIRQVQESSNKATGALVLTAGGIGCNGNVNAGNDVSASGSSPIFRLKNAAQSSVAFLLHASNDLTLSNESAGNIVFRLNAADRIRLESDRLAPIPDDSLYLGDGSRRWKQIFAVTSTISTSDRGEKDNIMPIDDKLLDAWADVEHVVFQWKDAIKEKGEKARVHAGHIAQQVKEALESKGIDAFSYGLLCEDEIFKDVVKTKKSKRAKKEIIKKESVVFEKNDAGALVRRSFIEEVEQVVTESVKVFNEDGTPYMIESTKEQPVTKMLDGKEVTVFESSTVLTPFYQEIEVIEEYKEEYTDSVSTGTKRMGLRYDQCLIVEAAYIRRELIRIKSKI